MVRTMHWINHYPLGKSIHFYGNYALDGDLYPVKLTEGNGYETHSSIFLFTFFNCDPAQNKKIPAYIGQ